MTEFLENRYGVYGHTIYQRCVQTIMDMSEGSTTPLRSSCSYSDPFTVRVGLYPRSVLSPFLFVIAMIPSFRRLGKRIHAVCTVLMILYCVAKINSNWKRI